MTHCIVERGRDGCFEEGDRCSEERSQEAPTERQLPQNGRVLSPNCGGQTGVKDTTVQVEIEQQLVEEDNLTELASILFSYFQ